MDFGVRLLGSCAFYVTLGKLLIPSVPQGLPTISVVCFLAESVATARLCTQALSFSQREQERTSAVKVLLGLSELEVIFCLRSPRHWAVWTNAFLLY